MTGPWTFDEASAKARDSSIAQGQAETFIRDAAKQAALADEAYRCALADAILRLHADGTAWSVCADIARGQKNVAGLRCQRDIAEGVQAAAVQAAWRCAADRRDVARFSDWSMRVQLREVDLPELEPVDALPIIGARRA